MPKYLVNADASLTILVRKAIEVEAASKEQAMNGITIPEDLAKASDDGWKVYSQEINESSLDARELITAETVLQKLREKEPHTRVDPIDRIAVTRDDAAALFSLPPAIFDDMVNRGFFPPPKHLDSVELYSVAHLEQAWQKMLASKETITQWEREFLGEAG